MKNLVISTVGTSLLTNPANKDEQIKLYKYSNCTEDECPEEIKNFIDSLIPKINEQLKNTDYHSIRRRSAELNGILGFYQEDFSKGKDDIHFLICTDTFQGKKSAEIVNQYLESKGIICQIYVPRSLSTKNKDVFSEGVKELLKLFDETLPNYKTNGYQIIFNLTGGFKSLQGYLNTIAMFYADKIIYIFESEQSELIEIPRLPIQIDTKPFENYKDKLILLSANKIYEINDFKDIPESAIDVIDGKVILSVWGEVIWNKIKYDLFDKLPQLPYLEYHKNFVDKFEEIIDKQIKSQILNTLAKVSVILENSKGNTVELSKGGIQLSPLESKEFEGKQVYHFRVNLSTRVNCVKKDNKLLLIDLGTHDETQR